LLEIRQEDLRFTKEETAEFLRRGTGLSFGTDDIVALERHIEGWAAGLQLAALSMRGRDDLKSFIHDFTASDRYILDYLVEEVFERQPAEVQNFLLQTSILRRLSAPLCDAVTGRTSSAEVLRSLEQSNLFIVPLDPAHNWCRYHHLFAELLHHRLRLSGIPEANLHQRASQWYESQGFMQDAVDHSLLAQDWGNAARLIGTVNEDMFKRGEVVTLLGWCGRLPQEVIHSNPELCLIHAWAALMTSQFEIAMPLLERTEQMAPPGSYLLGQVASAQAFLARAKRDNSRAIAKSEQALALLPETDVTVRGNIAMNLGLAYWHEGRLAEAERVLMQACGQCGKSGNMFALLTAQIFLARILAVQGKLHQAAAMCEKLIQAAGQVPILCLAHYDLATIYLEWNDLPRALGHFEKGFALAQRSGNVEFLQAGHLLRAILAHANGDESGALAALTEADNLAHDFPAIIRSRTAAFGVQLALARNDPQMLAHWSAQVNAEVDAHSFYRFMGLTRARLLIAQSEKAQAAESLKTLFETASSAGWGYGMLVVRILQSLAAKAGDESTQFIAEALRMGQPEGFIHSFVEASSAIIPLLQEAARRGIAPNYVGQILSAMGIERRKETPAQVNLIEPLSGREMEVLRLVTAGLSNREIALKLVISPGTAKTHIHNLCGKLGARNRTEAAMRAKELRLV
jgi:LuxR family maltose regulon positive regulatory protein